MSDPPTPPAAQTRSLPEEGACWNCGFLTQESPDNSSPEVDVAGRRLGIVAAVEDDPDSKDEPVTERPVSESSALVPYCFRGHASLFFEAIDEIVAKDTESDNNLRNAVVSVFNRDRACPKWYPYHPGRTPEAHYQEFRALKLEDRREAFEERLDRSNKEFLAGLEKQRREWEKDSGRWPSRLIWAAIILAVAEVAGTFLGLPVVTRLLGLD